MDLKSIVTALANDNITSTDAAALITKVEIAANVADQQLKDAQAAALDLNADPYAAATAVSTAEVMVARLDAALPQLDELYQKALRRERYAAWSARYDEMASKHADAVKQLTQAMQHLPELIEALAQAKATDAEVRSVMQEKPTHLRAANGDGKSLLTVECAARGITRVDDNHSLMNLKISISDPQQFDWPPPQPNWAIETVAAMRFPSGPSADWHEDIRLRNEQRSADAKKMAAFYQQQAAEREEREAQERATERSKQARQAAR